ADCLSSPSPDQIPDLVVFAPGQTQQKVAIPVLGDTVHEPGEVCVLRLTNPVNAALCVAQANLTIVDDDPLPGLEITDAAAVSEGNSGTRQAVFTVNLVGRT